MIGICLGDVTGIGPEVTLKALAVAPPSDAGAVLWKCPFGGAVGPVVVADGLAVAGNGNGELIAIDAETGKQAPATDSLAAR